MRMTITTILFLSILSTPLVQQAAADAPVMTEVGAGLYMLTWRGGNIGVSVGGDGVILIDDQYAPQVPGILEAIAEVTDADVRFVINTHWHGDHTGGNRILAEEEGALVIAHDNVRTRLAAGQLMPFFNAEVPPAVGGALPVVTFSGSVTLHFNDEEIHAFHVPPAHTDGDSIIHFRNADVIHMGDLFFNGLFPFVDTASGGDARGMVAATRRALAMAGPGTRVMPGHGPLTDRAGLEDYHDMLSVVVERIAALVAAGADEDAVVAARPAADYVDEWGGGFIGEERWVRMLYQNLAR